MSAFHGERVLVTGGSSGIGLETARAFVHAGARVWIAARPSERLARAAAVSGATPLAADLSTPGGAAGMVEQLAERTAALDVLVNCAGQMQLGWADELGSPSAERMAELNYLGTVRSIEAALPHLRAGRRRSIVTVTSIAGRIAPPFFAAYSGSKYALHGYLHALRQELRGEGFHVGIVLPGPVATPNFEGAFDTPHYPIPPLVPISAPERVAREIVAAVARRRREVTVPSRLGAAVRLGAAFPELVDLFYRWFSRKGLRERRGDGR